MKLISENLNGTLNLPTALRDHFPNCRVGVLDIETTGLSPSQHKVLPGGILVFEDNSLATILQFFAEQPQEEKALLSSYIEEIKKCDLLITYNGKAFDMNFLGIRGNKLGLDVSGFPYNLDLYLLIKSASDLRNKLPNLKQVTIEGYLGLSAQRSDTISGGESVELYQDYITTGNVESREKILLHNRDDLYQLYKLLDIVDDCDMEKGFHHLGFPGTTDLQITQTKRGLHYLKIEGIQRNNAVSYYSFGDFGESLQISFDKPTKAFQIMVPISQREGSYFLDLEALNLGDNLLVQADSYENGFLILEEQGQFNYKSLNEFIRILVKKIGKDIENIK